MKLWKPCAIAAALIVGGCSFSDSSGSLSDSVSSPFELASSLSSSGESSDTAYLDDVSDHARTIVASGGTVGDITAGLSRVARAHGITNWEAADATYLGFGRGLAKAGVGEAKLAHFQNALTDDSRHATLIATGFKGAIAR